MRIVVAPDEFKSSLAAPAAARAIAEGWLSARPSDELDLCPLSDGGPGFVDTLHEALGGELFALTVAGPLGALTPAVVLLVGDTAYIEAAQACGLHLLEQPSPEHAGTAGVGQLIAKAVELGAARVVVGVGGTASTDGGAGMLQALGAVADQDLSGGNAVLASLSAIDLSPALVAVAGIRLELASDVDNPLLGLTGSAKAFGPQKGADDSCVQRMDIALTHFAEVLGKRADGKNPAVALGAGAGGGIGFGLMHLGATRVAGISTVIEATGLAARIAQADLVITGEGRFDWQSLRGKVVSGVAAVALPALRPCVVIAGEVLVGRREYSALGISSAYAVSEIVGSYEQSFHRPVESLQAAAQRVARTWSTH